MNEEMAVTVMKGGAAVRIGHDSSVSWMRSKILAGLSDEAVRALLDTARPRHIAAKKNLIVRGGHPDHLYLLKTGRARSYILSEDGCEIVLLWAGPGAVLGLVSLLPSFPAYMVNTTTLTACDYLAWDHDTVRKLATEHPQIMENGFRVALYHLGAYMRRHINLVTKSAESRLANRLIELATSAGQIGDSGIGIDITNEQLSSLSDIGYFTTSRILSKWEQEGMLSKQRGRVTIHAPESLMVA
jgi:CRP-like cAMP-binding protein